jgi:RNA polymerase sigma-70 factor (ECF subfamily)
MLITRQRIIWQLRRRIPLQPRQEASKEGTSRTSTAERIPDPNAVNLDAVWEDEWRKNLMAAALDRVRRQVSPRQYQIFDLYVLQNWPVGEIARTLRINAGRIYLAKHRVSAVLAKEVKRLEALAASQPPHQATLSISGP